MTRTTASGRRGLVTALVIAATVVAVVVVARGLDSAALSGAVRTLVLDPVPTLLALAAFAGAFALRSWAWCRVLPRLSFGQSWAGIHVALLGNHVLPLRLGEPLRVVSVVRRAGIPVAPATATTITLRAADLLGLLVVTLVAAAVVIGGGELAWLDSAAVRVVVPALLIGLLAVGLAWTWRLRAGGDARLPGPLVVAATLLAWLAESALTYVVARAAALDLTIAEAVLVGTAAVLSQVVAVTPGGFGTYEAGATAAYVLLGHDAAVALAAALAAHALKTLYAIAVGGVAVVLPEPSLLGRLRLPASPPPRRSTPSATFGPVVLFMPAHDESAIIGSVVARAPSHVRGHEVVVLVVDDGSTDDTAVIAERAGAVVVRHGENRGLGAAVRTGLHESLRLDPVAVAFCDADGEYAPEELERLVDPILDGVADYVVGSRFAGDIERMRPHRRAGNLALTRVLRWVSRRPITDGQSGYRAFLPAAARDAEVVHDFNYAQVITLDLLGKGYRYSEVPISYAFRTTGTSFVRLGRYLRAVVPAVHRELNAPASADQRLPQEA